ncbi:hypothetical protein [Zavarzinella formosa]|uniref:hypothetical protein n=1 Tax=Zavarzinella formosa TaxID=360055 RepID=UPI00030B9346|nr:hypothetical protein [Zavarzinella formosa]
MQVQPFQTTSGMMSPGTSVHSFGGDPRINVPAGHGPVPPSLFAIFLQEILKRKALLVVWGIITIVLAAALIFKFAKPMYRAEGKLAYIPNYRGGTRPLYNPPNIQTMGQIIKSMDAPESVREKHMPWVSKDDFAKNLHVEVSKMSEFLDVSYDSTDPETAITIANAVMDESILYFGKYRQTTLKERAAEVKADLERAMADLQKANDEFSKAERSKGVSNIKVDIDNAKAALADEERNLRTLREAEAKLKLEFAFLKNRQESSQTDTERGVDESFNPILQALQSEYTVGQQTAQIYMAAKAKVIQLQSEEERMRVLTARGVNPISEYQKVVADLQANEAIVKQYEDSQELREAMKKRYDLLKKHLLSGKPLRLSNNSEMDKAAKDLATMPAVIASSEAQVNEKRIALTSLLTLQHDLEPKQVAITLTFNRVTQLSDQLNDSVGRDKDPNADDLKIATPASTGNGPYATNVPKLAASVLGLSSLLFLGYIALFAIPQVMASHHRAAAVQTQQPRALLAVVPVAANVPMNPQPTAAAPEQPKAPRLIEGSGGEMISLSEPVPAPTPAKPTPAHTVSAPTEHEIIIPLEATPAQPKPVPAKATQFPPSRASLSLKDLGSSSKSVPLAPTPIPQTPVPAPMPTKEPVQPIVKAPAPMTDAVQALAKRISQEGVDRGSIVLFTPTQEQLQLTPIIGDLGRQLSQEGNRVLVFDARTGVEHPSWAGPNTPGVANRVEGYLDGQSEATHCFVPTSMKNVEYSRADLTNRVSGVMSAHRFRQLVEEMRERYSLVLMVAPTMELGGNDPLLTALAEGLVLVTESTAPANQIRAYIDHLAEQVPAPVYGALSVPKA